MPHIILDTDPGIDDALALFLALASPEVQLEAITTTHGTVDVDLTTRNALTLLELAGRTEIPVASGSTRPLVRDRVSSEYVHGENGLGDAVLPELRTQPVRQHASDLLIERIQAFPGELTLVAIGPLTNLALALRRAPSIASQVLEVVIMGGALRVPGNITPAAEFNIYGDPHAAKVVLHAGWPIKLVSLDVTNTASVTHEQVQSLATNGSSITSFVEKMTRNYFQKNGVLRLHDPLCLCAAYCSDFITWQSAYVDVELTGTLTQGETVAYFKQKPGISAPNVQASVGVDANGFVTWAWERLGKLFPKG